ncbi:MAG TPA: RIP metalloprotease RseP [Chryseolinea sp.]|nr:RIP metalloprotease RseP [Chryseolinea sp.]
MEGFVMTAQILLSLSFLVAVHELGHLLAAKYFGMRVEQFSIGFPPKIWSFKKGETEYALSAIPLGGYVKISGMIDESMDTEAMKQEPQSWEFRSKPAWQRMIVMLGGIVVNVAIGILIFVSLTFIVGDEYLPVKEVNNNGGIYALEEAEKIGLKTGDQIIKVNGESFEDFQQVMKPDALLTTNAYYTVIRDGKEITVQIPTNMIELFNSKAAAATFLSPRFPAIVGEISEKSIAERVGLKVGDEFIEINGVPLKYQDEVLNVVKAARADKKSDSISFKVKRDSEILSFQQPFKKDTIIGFRPKDLDKSKFATINYGLGESFAVGTKRAFNVVFVQIKAFKKIFKGELSLRKSISSPIGIARAYGGTWDWYRFWSITGFLSMVLAFMNLLPIPALDGGHVVFLTYEMIARRKPSDKFLENAQKIGMVLLLILMVFAFGNDIIKLFQPG